MHSQLKQLQEKLTLPSPLHHISFGGDAFYLNQLISQQTLTILCKRDDLIHPIISGNKWRKLNPVLSKIVEQNIDTVISFGGGFSNHIHALGYTCMKLGIHLKAIIRGNYKDNLTPMLLDLRKWGVEIQYVNKEEYKLRHSTDYLQDLSKQHPNSLIVPEGGSSEHSLVGMITLVNELSSQIDLFAEAPKNDIKHTYILTPVASGGTLAGIINGCAKLFSESQKQNKYEKGISLNFHNTSIIGIGVLKGKGYLEDLVVNLLANVKQGKQPNWHISHEFHHGGYAKTSNELNMFIEKNQFIVNKTKYSADAVSNGFDYTNSSDELVKIEKVYSAKLFFALVEMIKNKQFQCDSRIILLHTGGIQGARSI